MTIIHESLIQKKMICDCGYHFTNEPWLEKYPFQCQKCHQHETQWQRAWKNPHAVKSWLCEDV